MRAATFHGPGDVRVTDVPDPRPTAQSDAIVRVTRAAICGTDLWTYSGARPAPPGARAGHEFVGVVDWVGADVAGVRVGDSVVAPFYVGDGTCAHCAAGWPTSCPQGRRWGVSGTDGGLGEAVRVPWAAANLVVVPGDLAADAALAAAVLPLADVAGTGHHAAVLGGVDARTAVAVVGDGAVGLSAVAAAVRLGARAVVAVGRHAARLRLAAAWGATDVVRTDRPTPAGAGAPVGGAPAAEAAERVAELTGGRGADVVLDCVGTPASLAAALELVRVGGQVAVVGSPGPEHTLALRALYSRNVGLRAGIAPVRRYLPALLDEVLGGRFDPRPLLDHEVPLARVADGFAAMAHRTAIKALVTVA